ncbi:MAG: hypothetical protein ACOCUV_00335 [bacterium]
MKSLVTSFLVFCVTVNVYAWPDTETFYGSVSTKSFVNEKQALDAGFQLEKKINQQKFKSWRQNHNCEWNSDINYRAKRVEIKKYYVKQQVQYEAVVSYEFECEPEYDS